MFYPSQSQEICGPGRARLLLDSEGQKPKCNSIRTLNISEGKAQTKHLQLRASLRVIMVKAFLVYTIFVHDTAMINNFMKN